MRIVIRIVLLAGFVAGCTQKNPNLCCIDESDCAAHGISTVTPCADGLACRGNQCVAETCTTQAECGASAPYCVDELCVSSCTEDAQCPGFGHDPSLTFCESGECIECRTSPDCTAAAPVCDGGACRGCTLDSECASAACGDDGTCLADSSLIYVDDATGLDAGACARTAPCKTIQFAVSNALPMRSHIVIAPGLYVGVVTINSLNTLSPTVTIHGGAATLKSPPGFDGVTLQVGNVSAVLHDLVFVGNGASGTALLSGTAPCTISRIKFQQTRIALQPGSNMVAHDVEIADPTDGIYLGAGTHVLLDRVTIHGGVRGIRAGTSGAVVSVSNLLVFDTSSTPIDLTDATGTAAFMTIGTSGDHVGSPSLICTAGLTVQSSILWTPGNVPFSGSCTVSTTIGGPMAAAGIMNVDPQFVDTTHRDFHLSSTSPAIDLVDSGPATDLDGGARPRRTRFDAGAYEAP